MNKKRLSTGFHPQNHQPEETPHLKHKIWKVVKITFLIVLVIIIAGVIFIKLDTSAAAEFTDNYLRPILGPERVIALEKIFFNLSDKADRTKYAFKTPDNPLIDQGTAPHDTVIPGDGLNLKPILSSNFKPIAGEGVWKDKPLSIFPGQEVMAYTFVRPDPDRAFAFTTIIQADMRKIQLGTVAGKKQPGGPVGKPGPGIIPDDIIQSGRLIAAFDGGFQYRDGQYGMIVGNTTYLPLKNDVGTLIGYKDGTMKIINFQGQTLGNNVAYVRQNCPILIDNGIITPADPKIKALWGRTLTSDIYTWRSGIGLTSAGNVVYAVGNNLTPITLASALKNAGAINAIQLDINPYWVRFNLFDSLGGGKYKSTTLTKGLQDGTKQFLGGYEKDFFYMYKK